jgi:hypothetical protein
VEMAVIGVNGCCLEMQSHDPIKTWTISMDIELQLLVDLVSSDSVLKVHSKGILFLFWESWVLG